MGCDDAVVSTMPFARACLPVWLSVRPFRMRDVGSSETQSMIRERSNFREVGATMCSAGEKFRSDAQADL